MHLIRKDKSFEVSGFKINKKYQYKSYTRNDEETGRTYNVGDNKVPSVTTILSGTQSPEKKKSLDRWRERVGYQEAARITAQASSRGTEMHYVLEQYLNGQGYLNLSEDGAQARLMAHEIINNLGPLKIIYGNEVNLAYKDRWAGSTDAVGEYNNIPTIIDFKQSNRPKREEYVIDYYYQIAAYSLAHKEQYGPINQGLICICTKDGLYQEFKMDNALLNQYENLWLERVDRYDQLKKEGA